MSFILTLVFIAIILLINEAWWRTKGGHGELSRKFAHILIGSFAAFWPFYLSWLQIEIIAIAFLTVVLISKRYKLFSAIHSVQRPTWGELFFALSIGVLPLITRDKWIFMAAILQMSLADGLAAVIGTTFSTNNTYTVFGHKKSIVGSLTFFVMSLMILIFYMLFAPEIAFSAYFILLAAFTTGLENLSAYGLDNLLIPVVTAIGLKLI